MNIIFALIPLGLLVLAAAVYVFFWAVRSGQFDDLDTPAWSVVLDDDTKPPASHSNPAEHDAADASEKQ
jgi:cbb3-type cytochrome oxidase maturation protein